MLSFQNRKNVKYLPFDSDDGMRKKWKAFTKKINVKIDDFSKILRDMIDFSGEPYTNVVNGHAFEKLWNANEGKWN